MIATIAALSMLMITGVTTRAATAIRMSMVIIGGDPWYTAPWTSIQGG
jgi:hypothetical protein